MKLELLFTGETWYEGDGAGVTVGNNGFMWAEGKGRLDGPTIRGSMRWSNAPQLAGGRWHPTLTGYIQTEDDATIVVWMDGYSVPDGDKRTVSVAVRFKSDAPAYEWLNDAIGVAEGSFDPATGRMPIRAYACTPEGLE